MLAKITLSYLPSQIVGPVAQLLSMVLWTHWFTPAEVGLYVLVLSIKDFTSNWASSWWTSFASRYMTTFTNTGDRASYDFTDITVLVGLALFQCLLVVAGALVILEQQATAGVIAAAVAWTGLEAIGRHNAARARARHEVFRYTLLMAITPVAALLVALLVFWLVPARVDLLLAIYAVSQAIAILAAGPLVGYKPAGGTFNRELVRKAAIYGFPIIVAGVFYWVSSNSVRFIVAKLFGTTALGLVAVGWALGQRVTEITSMMVTSAGFPIAVERMRVGGPDAARKQLAANGALLLGVLLPSAVGLSLVTPSLVSFLFADAFRETALYVIPLSAALGTFRFLRSHFTDQAFLIFEKPNYLITIGAVEAALAVVLGWSGGVLFGIPGALMGFVCAAVLTFTFSVLVAWRKFRLYIAMRDIAAIVAASACMAALVAQLPSSPSILTFAAQVALGATSYGLIIAILVPAVRTQLEVQIKRRLGK